MPHHQNPNTGMPVQLPPKSRFSTPTLTEIYEAGSHHPAKNMLETTLFTGKSAQTSTTMLPQAPSPNVIVVWGPAGCGKSSIAEGVARQLSFVYIEGDKYHSDNAIEKMSRGIPLSDADRWDWLIRLREAAKKALIAGKPGVVISCSALKRKYRDVLRILCLERPDAWLLFVYLHVDPDVLLRRIQSRQGHYMKDSMLKSQLESLEPPSRIEPDIITVDANRDLEDVCGFAVSAVRGGVLPNSLQSMEV